MKILPKSIKTRVNQLAHRRAQQYGLAVRDTVLGRLQKLAEEGKTFADLSTALDAMETGAAEMPTKGANQV